MISEDSGSSLRTVRPLGAETADICLRCSSQFIRHARFHFPLSAFLFATLMNLFFFFFLLLKFCGFPVTAHRPTHKTPASKYVMETQPERTLITSPSLPLFSPPTSLPSSRSPCLCNPPTNTLCLSLCVCLVRGCLRF